MHSVWIIGGLFVLFALWMADVDERWLAAGGAALLALAFNSIVSARNQAEKAFASIDAMLKKRFDLIPALVDSVSRYLEHESQVLEDVTKLSARRRAQRLRRRSGPSPSTPRPGACSRSSWRPPRATPSSRPARASSSSSER
jgi:hypothetical protein